MDPITRKETFLAKAAGEYNGDLPEPITNEEYYLAKIAEGGGGDSYTKAETDILLEDKQDTYTADNTAWDATPTQNSTKPVTSGGIYTALGGTVKVYCTQAEYDLLDPPDPNTEYNILEAAPVQASLLSTPRTVMIEPNEREEMFDELTEDEPIEGGDMR